MQESVGLINSELAHNAVDLALPMITAAMQRPEVGDGGNLHIVVVSPLPHNGSNTFEQAIIYEHSIGDRANWEVDFQAFARAKAELSWRTGLDTHTVQQLQPQLLQKGDTLLWGSAVLNGIVVGVSGAHPWYDEAFAGTIALCVRALAKEKIAIARTSGFYLS